MICELYAVASAINAAELAIPARRLRLVTFLMAFPACPASYAQCHYSGRKGGREQNDLARLYSPLLDLLLPIVIIRLDADSLTLGLGSG